MIAGSGNRRINGGASTLFLLHLIPMRRPEIANGSSGPALFHADISPVTSAKTARASEVLIVQAMGLSATVPRIDAGQTFPTDAPPQVNSRLGVTIHGQSAEVINKIGWLDLWIPLGLTFVSRPGLLPGQRRYN